jgi:hypothetical protein
MVPGKNLVIIDGEQLVNGLGPEVLKFIEAHEISHVIMGHDGPRSEDDEIDADLGAYILLSKSGKIDSIKTLLKQFKNRHGIKFNEKLLDIAIENKAKDIYHDSYAVNQLLELIKNSGVYKDKIEVFQVAKEDEVVIHGFQKESHLLKWGELPRHWLVNFQSNENSMRLLTIEVIPDDWEKDKLWNLNPEYPVRVLFDWKKKYVKDAH